MAQLLGLGKKGKLVDTTSGIIGDAAQGTGIGLAYNVIDKKFANGKMTAAGVKLFTTNVNGTPKDICLNVTDALTYASVVGLKLGFKKGDLIKGLAAVGAKKFFETWGYMDPPVVTPSGQTTTAINYPSMQSTNSAQLFAGGRI